MPRKAREDAGVVAFEVQVEDPLHGGEVRGGALCRNDSQCLAQGVGVVLVRPGAGVEMLDQGQFARVHPRDDGRTRHDAPFLRP